MEYVYLLANASLTLRVVKYLQQMPHLPVKFMTVIHQTDGWVILIKMNSPLNPQLAGDLWAFLNELGIPYSPPRHVNIALWSLEAGESAIEVMRRYKVVVVAHGNAQREKIEAFQQQMVRGLGYCPSTLA